MASRLQESSRPAIIFALFLSAYLITAWGIYLTFTSRVPSGNDFFSRWVGARALLLEGKDPYSSEVTREIQILMFGHLQPTDRDQVAFAYPLYVIFTFLPLVPLEYAQAQALWMAALVYLVVAAVIIILRLLGENASPLQISALILGAIFLYPTARGIFAGQFAILVFFLLTLAWWGTLKGQDAVAGTLLAISTIKPQIVLFIIPFFILLALVGKRWRIILGFALAIMVLFTSSWLLLPNWLPQFLDAAQAYQSYNRYYTGGRSPIGLALYALFPGGDYWPTLILSVALAGYTLFLWLQAFKYGRARLWQALGMTMVAALLIPAETASHNQVILLLPLIYWLVGWCKQGRKETVLAIILAFLALLIPWVLFLATVRGDHENPLMALPIPLFSLLAFTIGWPKAQGEGGDE